MRFRFHADDRNPETHARQLSHTDDDPGNAFPVMLLRMAMRGQSSRQAARSAARMLTGSIDLLQPRMLRPNWRLRTETRSRYDHLVANGVVDRHEWALVVLELLDAESQERAHGARTRFAAKVGVHVRTVGVWLEERVDVKETSVRAAARAYGLGEMELLIRVGFYSLDQLPERPPPSAFDAERQAVLDYPGLTDRQKKYILQELDRMEAEDEAALAQLREKDRRRRAERVTALMQQQHQRRSA
jgi:hypothetical protein